MGVAAHNIGAAEARFGPAALRRLAAQTRPCRCFRPTCATVPAGWWPRRCGSSPPARARRVALVGVLAERYATADFQVASAPPGGAGRAGAGEGKVRRGHRPGLPARGRTAATGRGPARGRRGGRRADRRSRSARGFWARRRCSARPRTRASSSPGSMPRRPARPIAGRGASSSSTGNSRRCPAGRPTSETSARSWPATISRRSRRPSRSRLPVNLPKGYAPWPERPPVGSATRTTTGCGGNPPMPPPGKSLEEKGAHVDPECQRCHTTGYGLPGGFASARRGAARHEVGCESCHGPSQGHAAEPAVRTAHYAQAKNYCTGCHDRENSPQFAFDNYWHKIAHGEQPAQKAAGSVAVRQSKDNP